MARIKKILSTPSLSKTKASTRTTDTSLVSGSIGYNLSTGSNLISYPFANPATAYEGNGEPYGLDTYGYWTPDEIDSEFDNNIYAITTAGSAAVKLNKSPGTSGSDNWIGSLIKLWPKQAYWVMVTGSGAITKTITKQLIPANYKTKFNGGWKWLAYPHSEYNNISPNGATIAGNDHNLLDEWLSDGYVINQLQGEGSAAVYTGNYGSGNWNGSFTFKTGSGFMAYDHGGMGVRTRAVFNRVASSGSDVGESNTDDPNEDSYYTASADICFGTGSDYIDTPIQSGHFVMGSGGGTFQVYDAMDSYCVMIKGKFSGSGNIPSSSILNHDNTQMVTPDDWGTTTGSIAVGMYNISGSGSVEDNSVCFGSSLFPSHPERSSWPPNWMYLTLHAQLKYTTVSGSISGSETEVDYYPTGSDQTSSLKVYSPSCDKVYMARLYQFTASKGYGGPYTITDIEDAKDVTYELTGSKNEVKIFDRHFIKLRNDIL